MKRIYLLLYGIIFTLLQSCTTSTVEQQASSSNDMAVKTVQAIDKKIKAAKSVEEVAQLLNGTVWHYTENLSNSQIGCWIKVAFANGQYTTYFAQPADGKWTEGGNGKYEIIEGRYTNTGKKYIAVAWNGNMKVEFLTIPCEFFLTLDQFQLNVGSSLVDGMANMNDRFAGRSYQESAMRKKTHWTGQMEFGDYAWE